MTDALWREERNIWHEYINNARQVLASVAGHPYDRITNNVHQPTAPVNSRKCSRGAESTSSRGKFMMYIIVSDT
jgi:hypothetical protein